MSRVAGADGKGAEIHIYDITAQRETSMLETHMDGQQPGMRWANSDDLIAFSTTKCYRWHIPDREMKLIYDLSTAKATP